MKLPIESLSDPGCSAENDCGQANHHDKDQRQTQARRELRGCGRENGPAGHRLSTEANEEENECGHDRRGDGIAGHGTLHQRLFGGRSGDWDGLMIECIG